MPNYTLYYFNGRGRAEICRMLFAAAGVQYTDKRFEFNEWDRYRKEMPCMSVPVLEIDSRYRMPETMAISRFLAREFGFYGRNNMDMFRIDYICDCFYEIMHDYMRYYHWKNGRFRHQSNSVLHCMGSKMSSCLSSTGTKPTVEYNWAAMQIRFMESCRRIFPFLERTLEMRNEGSFYFMGDQMTLCDIMCYCFTENPLMENPNLLSNFPKLAGLRSRVANHPKISMYLKRRCNTAW